MLKKIWKKLTSREVILYLVFGVLTTAVDYLVMWLMLKVLGEGGLQAQIANVIAWCAAVLFAYVTNRRYVFDSDEQTKDGIFKELLKFVGARLTSLLVSMVIIYVGVDLLHGSAMISKVASSVVVVILNYVFSKWIVFHRS
ncbi:MAG: GtrA family protein [Lachnospiraceae bacterium]|nr:GtrA family protein [Lachnospiraceae bacterium]